MPLKSDAVKDLDILAVLLFGNGIVKLNPNLSGTVPVSIIKLNSLAKKVGRHGWQCCECSAEIPSRPAALPLFKFFIRSSASSASNAESSVNGVPLYEDLFFVYKSCNSLFPSTSFIVDIFFK